LPANKTKKMHSSRRDAFKVINDIPIAKVWENKIEFLREYNIRNEKKCIVDKNYTDKIALIKFYPGQTPDVLDYYALKYKGVVIEGSGLGHLPVGESGNSWIPTLKKHIRQGFVVCVTTQCINGRVDPWVYANGRELMDAGVIFLEDMLAETALVKLGFVLGHHGWKGKAKEKMLENISGEIGKKLFSNSV
jgi:glutamyl-tRNA(Gln) amidotransferase subunit D